MLRLDIRRSSLLAGMIVGVHVAALGMLMTLGLLVWIDLLLMLVIGASAIHAVVLHAWQRSANSIASLEVADDCKVQVLDRRGTWHSAELMASSFITPWLTVLNLRMDGARLARHLIIVPDRVDADLFRRLRVLLRWKCGSALADKTVS